jgi:MraZ protein
LALIGEYRHTIDVKGRLIVPSRLREDFEDDVVMLSRYGLGDRIAMWSKSGWQNYEAFLLEQRRGADRSTETLVGRILASAFPEKIDKQGRILVPPSLREYAGVARDVVVTGQATHVELWDPARWDERGQEIDFDSVEITY